MLELLLDFHPLAIAEQKGGVSRKKMILAGAYVSRSLTNMEGVWAE